MTTALLARLAYVEGMIQEIVDLGMHEDDRGYRTLTIDEIGYDEGGKPVVLFGTMDTWHSRYSDDRPIEEDDDLFRRGQASPVVIGEHEGFEGGPTNIDSALIISERILAIDDMLAELRRSYVERQHDASLETMVASPLWQKARAEKAELQDQLLRLA